jgi:hypothetical protein
VRDACEDLARLAKVKTVMHLIGERLNPHCSP